MQVSIFISLKSDSHGLSSEAFIDRQAAVDSLTHYFPDEVQECLLSCLCGSEHDLVLRSVASTF
jgi:hypothetical protein